ncbi:hypothetical protein ACWPKO_25235 (plasmid) [Coraliomargarita sp. W4R53]
MTEGDALRRDAASRPPAESIDAAQERPAAEPAPTQRPAEGPPVLEGPSREGPIMEGPSPDVAAAVAASTLPGAHRGGFSRLPTAPVAITSQSAPAEPGTETNPVPFTQWAMPDSPAPYRGLAGWALAFSIVGLLVSMFVGWGFPIGLVGIISAIIALFRPIESRAVAVWALVLGILSVLYSIGWLLFAAQVANIWA